jgi:hypothetical protein
MITIEYCEDGIAVSDFNYQVWIDTVKSMKGDHCFRVSTSLPIDLVRIAILKDEILYSNVNFKYEGKLLQPNQYGSLSDWPFGFCGVEADMCGQILRLAAAKRKALVSGKVICNMRNKCHIGDPTECGGAVPHERGGECGKCPNGMKLGAQCEPI